ncbi:tRNA1(Val) (adenine(37)-N6)-methyltransferase [Clostridium botulinum C]|uniref:tRNA1(Val) (Adenine(37)-N6)-methyltransferase n=2 Tax=Clostridium botulinum TaxID=1491 RepID=A0A9Q4TN74_CLOBO|nr:tRNA1(Val) (adenine(37)-N6)-methyltransferase [Clostridium botulinum]MCD3195488.1 tRNA1(Val) (adenine(37)-N6)-methyltransferase [Clostridium botulinum C]MCD3200904.1 tRNA1(Val) (adenine(37)-N6)-methyltransferase [Clostridium botulinum C]MCD3206339.1 tRNA1(Val) (adenine(37)-N6)-methyltransferase [Clostridium botulinum C]MCD3208887.1 tRNA1(Val) (adenine(37)-N6)-methyltransferase [Clostridium botulinum C]MCD3226067.1 tRNA1(Val) (adenine(37)-N6)-methyltransferase [Clostridium botulinum C]
MDLVKSGETLDDLQLNGIHVIQKKDGFRFGIDAVLLANFAKVKNGDRVVDLCSGTGIVPFIIAGKTKASNITGIEIQRDMTEMANRSTKFNKLQDKIEFICEDLTNINNIKKISKADVVTVNPPYKLCNSGIVNPNDKMAIARHEICCNLEDVIIACRTLLKDNKRMYMVHRPDRLADIITLMRKNKIEPKRIQMVHPNTKKPPNIVLIEGQRDGGAFLKWEPPIYVYNDEGGYSDQIQVIYGRK